MRERVSVGLLASLAALAFLAGPVAQAQSIGSLPVVGQVAGLLKG